MRVRVRCVGILRGCRAELPSLFPVLTCGESLLVYVCVGVCSQPKLSTHTDEATVPFGRRVRGICKFFAMSWKALWTNSFPFSFVPLAVYFLPLVSGFSATWLLNCQMREMSTCHLAEQAEHKGNRRSRKSERERDRERGSNTNSTLDWCNQVSCNRSC